MEKPAKESFKARVYAGLLQLVMGALSLTYRIESFEGKERWLSLQKGETPVILAAWHNRIFYLAMLIKSQLLGHGFKMAIMSSLSGDGEIGAALGRRAGLRVVRGSPTRGGTAGFRRFFRIMKSENCSVLILPDGSKGPKYQAKMGVVVLAQLSGNPVIPISFSADRCWRAGSWDRLIIPKPFARIRVALGDEIRVDRDASGDELESCRQAVESSLMELNQRVAAASTGGGDAYAVPTVH